MKSNIILIFSILFTISFSCKTDEIILHGDLSGLVSDALTNKPLEAVKVILDTSYDSTNTGSDGRYLFKGLTPGSYEIEASKYSYGTSIKNVTITSAETKKIDFTLNGIPVPSICSKGLDFGFESTTLSFTITNIGKGKFTYVFTPNEDWIIVSPSTGEVVTEIDTITVTINRTELTKSTYKASIKLTSVINQGSIPDIIIGVYLNGLMDRDGNYYKIVTIGAQIWMAENLNVGTSISNVSEQTNNGIFEKFCYSGDCTVYGGLYQWDEAMQYSPSDDRIIGTTQGICPVGWHIPTINEWNTLVLFLGGIEVAGGKLKEAGTEHWKSPNVGATNETGFTALPAGYLGFDRIFYQLGETANWWSSTVAPGIEYPSGKGIRTAYLFNYSSSISIFGDAYPQNRGVSVRCVKN